MGPNKESYSLQKQDVMVAERQNERWTQRQGFTRGNRFIQGIRSTGERPGEALGQLWLENCMER